MGSPQPPGGCRDLSPWRVQVPAPPIVPPVPKGTIEAMNTTTSLSEVAAGLRARAATAELRARLLHDMARGEERQAAALRGYAEELDPS